MKWHSLIYVGLTWAKYYLMYRYNRWCLSINSWWWQVNRSINPWDDRPNKQSCHGKFHGKLNECWFKGTLVSRGTYRCRQRLFRWMTWDDNEKRISTYVSCQRWLPRRGFEPAFDHWSDHSPIYTITTAQSFHGDGRPNDQLFHLQLFWWWPKS